MCPGDSAYAHYTIEFEIDSDEEGFDFYTDLHDPKWQFSIIIDGRSQELPSKYGRYASIGGFELYYPGTHSSKIEIKLNGTVPEVGVTGNYSIIRVTQYDYDGSTAYEETVQAVFLNPSEIDGILLTREGELNTLRAYLDEKYLSGVDTSLAEEKYSDAADAIEQASYSGASTANSLLSYASESIDESYLLADKAWAEYWIELSESRIEAVEDMIAVFEDEGLSDDSRVWVIRSYLDNAETLLTLARDKLSIPDYVSAGGYAEQAGDKAKSGYNYAVELNDDLGINSDSTAFIEPTRTVAVTSTATKSSSGVAIGELIPEVDEGSGLDDIDELLHSEVSVESTIQIGAKIVDLIMFCIDFLSDLLAMASDN